MDDKQARLTIMRAMEDFTKQVMSGDFPKFTIELEKGPVVFRGHVHSLQWHPPADFTNPQEPMLVDAGEIDMTVVFTGEIPLDIRPRGVSNSHLCDVG